MNLKKKKTTLLESQTGKPSDVGRMLIKEGLLCQGVGDHSGVHHQENATLRAVRALCTLPFAPA